MKEEIFKKLLEYLESTKDFMLEQCPEIIQQILQYEKYSNILGSCILFILLCVGMWIGIYFYRHPKYDKYESRDVGSTIGCFAPLIVCPIMFVQMCVCVNNLVKITVAPKYFIIETLTKLIK